MNDREGQTRTVRQYFRQIGPIPSYFRLTEIARWRDLNQGSEPDRAIILIYRSLRIKHSDTCRIDLMCRVREREEVVSERILFVLNYLCVDGNCLVVWNPLYMILCIQLELTISEVIICPQVRRD